MSDPVPTPPIYSPVDCSPEAIEARNRALAELLAAYRSGVSQVVDRNRSVTYRTQKDMLAALRGMRAEVYYCTYGAWPTGPSACPFGVS